MVVAPSAFASADEDKTRFESSGFLQSLDTFIAEQMAKESAGIKLKKPGAIGEIELSIRRNNSTQNNSFALSDSSNLGNSTIDGLSERPDFSSLLAPNGQMRSSYGPELSGSTSSLDLSFARDKNDPTDRGIEVSIESAYRRSVQGIQALAGFSDEGAADLEYNLGVTLGYAGFGVDATVTRQTSLFENELHGFDLGFSYQSTRWAARLSLSGYREGADLYGIENKFRSIMSVELGASYHITSRLGVRGGVRYYDYRDQWLINPAAGDNAQMIFLGGRLDF